MAPRTTGFREPQGDMTRLKWKAGLAAGAPGRLLVSATRFTYRHWWHLPLVFWHGLVVRQGWGKIEGAVGVSICADLSRRTTYTVSVWRNVQDLSRWLRSPYHAALMRNYRSRLESVDAAKWYTERFVLREAWKEALQRLKCEESAVA